MIKINRLNSLKKVFRSFIYSFEDLEVFNNSYFQNVIKNIYKNKKILEKSIAIYGDVDKLKKLNNRLGTKIGDIGLHNTIAITKEQFPNDSIMFRIGGDEFGVILNNCTLKEADKYINDVNEALLETKNKANTYGLGITSSRHRI